MDVKQDREDAESKALEVLRFGPDALDLLVELGNTTNMANIDASKKKKTIRQIVREEVAMAINEVIIC